MSERVVYRTCSLCEATCGLEISVRNDQVTQIRGDREDVFSRGFLCPKGATLADLHDDPDRLRCPQIREGNTWRDATWDEAFEAIERGLLPIRERDRNSIGVYLGNPNTHNLAGTFYLRPLLKSIGTRNIFSASTVDQMPRHVACGLMFGAGGLMPVPDLDRTDYLLMLGANPLDSNGSLCTAPDFPGRLAAIRKRGGRVVVVDPRRTRTAKKADEHLYIRPGTDVDFLLALSAVLFEEDLVGLDLKDAAAWIDGLDTLPELLRDYRPEKSAAVTGIDASTTRRIAREFAAAPSAAAYGRIGAHTVEFGTLTAWATDLLNILTGNLDRAGGVMFPNPAHGKRTRAEPGRGRGYQIGRWHSRVGNHPETQGEFPVAALSDEIDTVGDGQIRAMITVGGNPVLSTPNGPRLDGALAGLEFMVSVDIYRNETSRHANVILPPPSPLERSHYDAAFYSIAVRNVANYSEPVFDATGPSESDILARLALVIDGKGAGADPAIIDQLLVGTLIAAAAADEEAPMATRDPEEIENMLGDGPGTDRILDILLRTGPYGDGFGADPDGLSLERLRANPHGVDFGPLEPRLSGILRTASGKVEVVPEPIVNDLDRLAARRAAAQPDPNGDEMLLIGRRHIRSNNSWMHNIAPLVSGKPRCTLMLHPDDAAARNLADGATARVTSRVGSLEVGVELTTDLMPGVASLPHGWGHDLPGTDMRVAREHAGVNSNRLTDEGAIDTLSGNAVLNGIPVKIEAAPDAG
jgi:anaerobic selenocysteine-containing dehydrogenase